jgi:hypothetical protein
LAKVTYEQEPANFLTGFFCGISYWVPQKVLITLPIHLFLLRNTHHSIPQGWKNRFDCFSICFYFGFSSKKSKPIFCISQISQEISCIIPSFCAVSIPSLISNFTPKVYNVTACYWIFFIFFCYAVPFFSWYFTEWL